MKENSRKTEKSTEASALTLLPPSLNSCAALYELAKSASELAYAPYSNFKVGAALLCRDGKVYLGANIENAAYSAGICAERSAFVRALTDGERDFVAIAVAGRPAGAADTKELSPISELEKLDRAVSSKDSVKNADFVYCPPCGVCRQFMNEFCGRDFGIVLGRNGETEIYTLGDMLPEAFGYQSAK